MWSFDESAKFLPEAFSSSKLIILLVTLRFHLSTRTSDRLWVSTVTLSKVCACLLTCRCRSKTLFWILKKLPLVLFSWSWMDALHWDSCYSQSFPWIAEVVLPICFLGTSNTWGRGDLIKSIFAEGRQSILKWVCAYVFSFVFWLIRSFPKFFRIEAAILILVFIIVLSCSFFVDKH